MLIILIMIVIFVVCFVWGVSLIIAFIGGIFTFIGGELAKHDEILIEEAKEKYGVKNPNREMIAQVRKDRKQRKKNEKKRRKYEAKQKKTKW